MTGWNPEAGDWYPLSAGVPGGGMEAIAGATGQWGLADPVSAAAITPRFPGLFSPNTDKDCEQFFNIIACPAAIIDCFIDLPFIPPPISVGLCVFGIATSCLGFDFGPLNYIGCIGIASGLTCLGKEFLCRDIVASLDPNDIIGPEGAAPRHFHAGPPPPRRPPPGPVHGFPPRGCSGGPGERVRELHRPSEPG